MAQVSQQVTIKNKYGFHVRPSTSFSKLSMGFSSKVTVNLDGGSPVDGKNIMMLMTLGATCDQQITITCDGDDAEQALKELVALVESSFDGIE